MRFNTDEEVALFRKLCLREGVPEPTREYKFAAPDRKWAFDFAWPDKRVALEVEGGVFSNGRHVRGAGFLKDMEKYNTAASRGWLVLRCTPATRDTLETVHLVQRALNLTTIDR